MLTQKSLRKVRRGKNSKLERRRLNNKGLDQKLAIYPTEQDYEHYGVWVEK